MENLNIQARLIFEGIGRPAEHLTEALNQLLESLSKEKGLTLVNKQINEPKKLENKDQDGKLVEVTEQQQLYTAFIEAEIKVENLLKLFDICFRYMPAHVEMIYPENIKLNNGDMNAVLNGLLARLHNYDSIAKSAIMNNQILTKQLEALKSSRKEMNNALPLEVSYGDKELAPELEEKGKKSKTKKAKQA